MIHEETARLILREFMRYKKSLGTWDEEDKYFLKVFWDKYCGGSFFKQITK